ncbi:IS605 OrfB family transposase [Erysipelotrichaceae bacterium 6_1_45]|uniref:RNA-guided endonuclease TnpB family protein n=1 Tax=Clostridium innocuum TaxID=1522 RepID=UPI000246CEDA|nr:RNA-guided endonuclease TnpB family protein [[Clostridium] innocuum]EHO32516.1 IS605 OrfB family transposase [Erysipelotrichaceae bacterium 6_1_45]MCQ4711477.1 transposase [[Clostridium] innocuum]
MYICVKLQLKANIEVENELKQYERHFKEEINRITEIFRQRGHSFELRYKEISNHISYNSKHLVLAQAKQKYAAEVKKEKYSAPFSSVWSNSSYQLKEHSVVLELGLYRHRNMLELPCYINEQQRKRLQSGPHTNMKLICHRGKWSALIYVQIIFKPNGEKATMGIDIGLKVPAVAALDSGEIRFFGNGRQIRFQQRKYQSHIEAMLRHHQKKKIYHFQHKLHHVLSDFDHKTAKQIIDYAIEKHVGVIKMENLMSINKKYEKSKSKSLHHWSYRRLQDYIEYKAFIAGIRVVYINPYNTSRTCPQCGKINHPKDRFYCCICGFRGHRDAVAAMNILHAL